MANEPASMRLLDQLPAIYRASGPDSDLARLLGVFEALLFADAQPTPHRLPAIEHRIESLPALLTPLGLHDDSGPGLSEHAGDSDDDAAARSTRTPGRFLPWLAAWLAFAPHALVEPARLRRVIAGIVPLYGLRGTGQFMQALLRLCFDEITRVRIDDSEFSGFRVGGSILGVDSWLIEDRPFWFRIEVECLPSANEREKARFEQRLRAVIEFSKPAHTSYELRVRASDTAASR